MFDFPPVRVGEPVAISATTYVAFERCPEQAAARLRGEYGQESRASFVGGLAHGVFARHLAAGPIDAAQFVQVCREEIGASPGLNAGIHALGLKRHDLRAIIGEVGDLYERFKRFPSVGFEAAEVELEVEPAPGVLLRGRIDAVFTDGTVGLRLVDWKTSGMGDAARQLAFYTLVWALERGVVPDTVEAFSVGTGERIIDTPSEADAYRTAVEVASLVDALRLARAEGTELERRGGPWCGHCPLLADCSEGIAAQAVLVP